MPSMGAVSRKHGAEQDGGAHHAAVPAIPFTHAAHEQVEFVDSLANAISANVVKIPQIDVPARGYLKNEWLRVKGSGGTKGPAATKEDFPFSVLDSVAFYDVGGGEIVNPISGYDLYLINKYGGYVYSADPADHPDFSADAIAYNFALRVPFEISAADALGCLANQNSQSKYKLRLNQADNGSLYSTQPTAQSNANIDVYSELWSQPPGQTDRGVPILNRPPLLGTTQYWSVQSVQIAAAGRQEIELQRRGNQLRTVIGIWRDNTGARSDAFPDPVRFVWDSREQAELTPQYIRQVMRERYGTTRKAYDTGVYVFDWSHDVLAHPGGMDDGHLWIRSKSSSRIEFRANFLSAGTLTLLINDVAPVAVVDQYSDGGATGGAIENTVG